MSESHVSVIQGGMGVGVSNWRLARAVSITGQLGVVSGTALDVVLARRLADGDPTGVMRRALDAFPDTAMASRVKDRWFRSGGRREGEPYPHVPMLTLDPLPATLELSIVAAFVEVYLAKEDHDGRVGINLLTKVQPPTPSTLYGAMLAGVDDVVMGAGIPTQIPAMLDRLADRAGMEMVIDADEVPEGRCVTMRFSPDRFPVATDTPLRRPRFLAIVSSVALANYLARDPNIRPDGFVVESPNAGGHNAPPRGKARLDARGQPVYGPKDEVDLAKLASLGLPFWLAGGQASAERLAAARSAGAEGVQIGTAFALCSESGIDPRIKTQIFDSLQNDALVINTDARASSSGYPFKVASIPGTVSDPEVYRRRPRVCDLGFLRTPYIRGDGKVGYRCAAEPVARFVRKGGGIAETEGRKCLCNGLMATIGSGQQRTDGPEPALVTLGDDVEPIRTLLESVGRNYRAADVVNLVLR